MSDESPKFYAIQNAAGEWYQARKRYRASCFTVGLKKAKIYGNISQARGRISMFLNDTGVTHKLVEFSLGESRVLDETERLEKTQAEKQLKLREAVDRRAAQQLEYAQAAKRRAEADVKRFSAILKR